MTRRPTSTPDRILAVADDAAAHRLHGAVGVQQFFADWANLAATSRWTSTTSPRSWGGPDPGDIGGAAAGTADGFAGLLDAVGLADLAALL